MRFLVTDSRPYVGCVDDTVTLGYLCITDLLLNIFGKGPYFGMPRPETIPRAVIPGVTWAAQDTLRNLKALTLEGHVRLDRDSFAKMVISTPNLESFRSFDNTLIRIR